MTENSILLPTGKEHISFSELSNWTECSYRHKLLYVDKLGEDAYSIHLVFGTAIHAVCENYIKTGKLDTEIATKYLVENLKESPANSAKAHQWVKDICADIPDFMNTTFPNWKMIEAEEFLMEKVFKDSEHPKFGKFKGYIDAIIEAPTVNTKKKKDVTWILDWKTCLWGWRVDQKRDPQKRLQLALYKVYWSKKHNVDLKNIRCGFVLLKKQAKAGRHCELVQISVGDKTLNSAELAVKNMLRCLSKGISIKNKESCKWCEFKGTDHCK